MKGDTIMKNQYSQYHQTKSECLPTHPRYNNIPRLEVNADVSRAKYADILKQHLGVADSVARLVSVFKSITSKAQLSDIDELLDMPVAELFAQINKIVIANASSKPRNIYEEEKEFDLNGKLTKDQLFYLLSKYDCLDWSEDDELKDIALNRVKIMHVLVEELVRLAPEYHFTYELLTNKANKKWFYEFKQEDPESMEIIEGDRLIVRKYCKPLFNNEVFLEFMGYKCKLIKTFFEEHLELFKEKGEDILFTKFSKKEFVESAKEWFDFKENDPEGWRDLEYPHTLDFKYNQYMQMILDPKKGLLARVILNYERLERLAYLRQIGICIGDLIQQEDISWLRWFYQKSSKDVLKMVITMNELGLKMFYGHTKKDNGYDQEYYSKINVYTMERVTPDFFEHIWLTGFADPLVLGSGAILNIYNRYFRDQEVRPTFLEPQKPVRKSVNGPKKPIIKKKNN